MFLHCFHTLTSLQTLYSVSELLWPGGECGLYDFQLLDMIKSSIAVNPVNVPAM